MHNRCTGRSSQGFTLIEIMVGMVLTGVLVAGVAGLWGMVAEQFFRVSLRQKAVFVLHGHMERLAQLYRFGNIAANMSVNPSTTGYIHPPLAATVAHSILRVDTTGRATDLLMQTVAANKAAFPEGNILNLNNTAAGVADRNLVWLDRDKDLTAQLSWTLDQSLDPLSEECFPDAQTGAGCQILTLYLDYPYRFTAGNPPTNVALDTVETISLQTIVGRTRQ